MRRGTLWQALSAVVMAVMLLQPLIFSTGQILAPSPAWADNDDPRYFPDTGFRISDDRFWDYFQKRGGLRTFGFPVSRKFTLLGSEVQIFQRRIIQIRPDGGVGLVNLLDSDMLPYTSINGATLPAKDDALVAKAPPVGSPNYADAISQFVQDNSPDTWNNLATNYYQTFNDTVKLEDAFPDGDGNPNWLPGLNLEMWGVPVSAAAIDPKNFNFAYLRFQRGIMHYDNTSGLTQGLLLADYFKSILTGQNLPFDLAGPAAQSRYYKQYDNSKPDGVANPATLPNSNLKNAFEKDTPSAGGDTLPPGTTPTPIPSPSPTATGSTGLAYGMQVHMFGQDQNRILGMVKGAGFGWIKQQVRWNEIEGSKGNINFGKLDPMVANASAQGVKVLFSVVTVPSWSRGDHRTVGPPDNANDLADFMAAIAARYKGKVQAYEVWNEQNMSREWTPPINACAYVSMLQVVAPRIKAADPNAIVVSGALTPTGWNDPNGAIDDAIYLDQMYQCNGGVFKTLGDAVGAHAVGYNNAPDDWLDKHTVSTQGFKDHGSFYFRRIWQLHDIMAKYGDPRQMWLTEYHWGSAQAPVPAGYEWTTALDENTVAGFFVRSIEMMRAEPWVGGFFIWNLNFRTMGNYHSDETAIFGILNEDWSPRAIYSRLRDMPK
ncbi:MAG: cellulase family glycosylhydrolase [Chloroflexi bacterium]|nr:cellulase family glycosylhydrolase [Chloroflexota bacterium]